MTIIYTGTVRQLEDFGTDTLVTVKMEIRSDAGEITLRCSRETAKLYMPGTQVQLQVYPTPTETAP